MTDKLTKTLIDKSEWPDGPWKLEPDKVSWVDPTTGYYCFLNRNGRYGHWNGYVGIEKQHPLYKKNYKYLVETEINDQIQIHGGITYADFMNEESTGCWWIGFDCAHAWDYWPRNFSSNFGIKEKKILKNINLEFAIKEVEKNLEKNIKNYKNIDFVIKEVESLAKQLKKIECE